MTRLYAYSLLINAYIGWRVLPDLPPLAGVTLATIALLVLTALLVPLGMFRLRNLSVAGIVGMLWSASMFSWFFLSAYPLPKSKTD